MSALTLKLVRDLARMKGQVLTIALVVACGIAAFVTLRSTFDSLAEARAAYYERERFGDVFVDCERAPMAVLDELARVPGVERLQASVREHVTVPIEGQRAPATGLVVGIPVDRPAVLDAVRLRSGRMPEVGHTDEVLVLESFALAHGLSSGSRLSIVAAGTLRHLSVVGTAVAPDFLFSVAEGQLTVDDKRFGVFWMEQAAAGAFFEKSGAFDHVSLALGPGTQKAGVLQEIDRLLAPYGGRPSFGRDKHPSDRMLTQELEQLRGMALVVPIIFLGVAAFLLNIVMSRVITLARPEIAALKALGYTGREVALHYLELALAVVLLGDVVGVALGAYLGEAMANLYSQYFHFPDQLYRLDPQIAAVAVGTSLAAGVVGALGAVRGVQRLPPAEAMRPPAPANFRRGLFERLGLFAVLPASARMVLRELGRRPLRALVSSLGIAFSVSILVVGRFNVDVLDGFIELQFERAFREDLTVRFRRPIPLEALGELASIDGVLSAEPQRTSAFELERGVVRRERALVGHFEGERLRQLMSGQRERVPVPEEGLVLDDYTAELLGVRAGDVVTARLLEGERRTLELPVERVFQGLTAMEAHADARYVSRLLREEPRMTSAALSIDRRELDAVSKRLASYPEVSAVGRREDMLDAFEKVTGEMMLTMTLILTMFAGVIAVGVVYNDARIALATQARELASLRVLGFERGEVSALLLGQLAFEVVLALAPGIGIGVGLAKLVMTTVDPEVYRFPLEFADKTFVFACGVVIVAALLSALIVRRRIDHLDLVEVLKTRE